MATTTLTGTTGNNLLNAPGSVSTLVQGLQGADTINLALANDEAQAGKGNDIVTLARQGIVSNTISGGDGSDTVLFRSAGQFNGLVNLDAGNDSIAFSGNQVALINGGSIYGGLGSDTIRLQNSITNGAVGGGSSADLLTFSGQAAQVFTSSRIEGGMNADTISINAGASTFVTVQGGKGFDYISLSQQAAGRTLTQSQVGGGQGNDSIVIGAGQVSSVAGGGLDDTIRFGNNFALASAVIYGDALGVTTAGSGVGGAADGNDLITNSAVSLNVQASIYGGGGNDTINFFSRSGGQLNGGDGNDLIRLGSAGGGLNLSAGAYGLGAITGGAGNDTINVALSGTGNANFGTISGGAGTDLINFRMQNSSAAGSGITNASTVNAVISGVSGDTLRVFTQLAFSAGGAQVGANWVGNAGTISIASANGLGSALNTAVAGSIAVFSNGTDSIIGFKVGATSESGAAQILVKGIDLTIATGFGATTTSATTFRFSVAVNTGGGLNITFA